jgi:hypothetical protein
MDYSIVAGIIGFGLALLFLVYARNKKRVVAPDSSSASKRPDIISRAAGGIYTGHKILNNIMAVAIVGAVLVGSFFDHLMGIIVLATVAVMVLVALIWKFSNWPRNVPQQPPIHVKIIK